MKRNYRFRSGRVFPIPERNFICVRQYSRSKFVRSFAVAWDRNFINYLGSLLLKLFEIKVLIVWNNIILAEQKKLFKLGFKLLVLSREEKISRVIIQFAFVWKLELMIKISIR